MKLPEFTALIEDFTRGNPDNAAFGEKLIGLLDRNPGIHPTDLLTHTQFLLNQGKLNPEQFGNVSRLLAELNIQRAATTPDSDMENGDETEAGTAITVQAPPGMHGHGETLIMSDDSEGSWDETREPRSAPPEPAGDAVRSEARTASPGQPEPPRDQPDPKKTKPVKVGSILKGRFKLLEIIGYGGMGYVFKAIDLVKVQAQDSNPYVAIKVLSNAFKKHSKAFIAMQREASKAQRLAHPNITTVYDFDRDNDTIYMTMELLHGQPFDRLIAQLPPGGLPQQVALRYIEDLCHGLTYAHKQQLIHCDLKPANIFLCDSGAVKLLDFGITRAFKKEQQESKDDTLFDPAKLKALTPAYASLEMFRGEPPDPRDDIYAVACVTYELLTGNHPYQKVAAGQALELNLKPPPVKGLSRRQQKALLGALALERENRTPTIEKFMQGIKPPKNHVKQLLIGSILMLAAGGLLLIKPVQTQFKEEAQLNLIQSIKNGDQTQLVSLLESIHDKDESTRAYLTSVLRREIIIYYQNRINAAINAKEKRYDFPEASRLLNQVKKLYPDSASLTEAEKQLTARKQRLIDMLLRNYRELSDKGMDTGRVLEILREAEPGHPLLERADKSRGKQPGF